MPPATALLALAQSPHTDHLSGPKSWRPARQLSVGGPVQEAPVQTKKLSLQLLDRARPTGPQYMGSLGGRDEAGWGLLTRGLKAAEVRGPRMLSRLVLLTPQVHAFCRRCCAS